MGSYAGSLSEFTELMAMAVKGLVPGLPTTTHELESANDILNKLESGQVVGRAVLAP